MALGLQPSVGHQTTRACSAFPAPTKDEEKCSPAQVQMQHEASEGSPTRGQREEPEVEG